MAARHIRWARRMGACETTPPTTHRGHHTTLESQPLKRKNSQPGCDAVTGPDSGTLLTSMTLMGAAVGHFARGGAVAWAACCAEAMRACSRLLWAPRQYTWPQLWQRENTW
jgi:hypothetical protein